MKYEICMGALLVLPKPVEEQTSAQTSQKFPMAGDSKRWCDDDDSDDDNDHDDDDDNNDDEQMSQVIM